MDPSDLLVNYNIRQKCAAANSQSQNEQFGDGQMRLGGSHLIDDEDYRLVAMKYKMAADVKLHPC